MCARKVGWLQALKLGLLVIARAVIEGRQRKVVQGSHAIQRKELQPLVIPPANASQVIVFGSHYRA